MFDSSWLVKTQADFGGAWLTPLINESSVPSTAGLLAKNCRFNPGQVATRYGCSTVFNPSNVVTGMFNWLFTHPALGVKNFLVWYASDYGGLRIADLASPGTGTNLYTQSAYSATFATSGARLYFAQFTSSILGSGHGRVYGYDAVGVASGPDNLFPRPMLTTEITMTPSETASGSVTKGLRNFGFIITSRSGYTGRFSPANTSLVFVPGSFTSSGGKNLQVNLAPTGVWPADSQYVQLIATTTANLSRYFFVPNTRIVVPAGGSFAQNVVMDVSDDSLTTFGTDATQYANLLTQDSSNSAPFAPIVIFEYGNRITYITNSTGFGSCAFHSQPNNYQALSADQNIRYLPGQKQMITGFAIGQTCYYLGPFWTFSDQDNGDIPVNWTAPLFVDGYHGTLSPRGVDVNVAGGFAWVACRDGLYRFTGGRYETLPISYYQQPDWDRINWASAGHTVIVKDNPSNHVVTVLAPLDGASAPNFELTWDYTNGSTPETVKYSLFNRSGFNSSAMCITKNQTTAKYEMWLGPGVSGPIARLNDGSEGSPYRDISAAIDCQYETANFPGEDSQRGQLQHHHGGEFRISGAGSAGMTMYSLDKAASDVLQDVALSSSPGIEVSNLGDMLAESIRYGITNKNTLDNWFVLSLIRHGYNPYSEQR